MTTPDSTGPQPGSNPEAEKVIADIEVTRAELGETVDALAGKFDVKARARGTVDDARQQVDRRIATVRDAATDDSGNPTTAATVVGAVVALLLVITVVSAARRRRRR